MPGGGVAYLRCIASLSKVKVSSEEQPGVNLIKRALEEPLRQIAANAGVEGAIVVDQVCKNTGAYGFNALTEEYEDLIKAGVIDPTKVTRTALQNAASVAGLMLTTEAMIADLPKKEDKGMPAGMGGMGGMGGMDGMM